MLPERSPSLPNYPTRFSNGTMVLALAVVSGPSPPWSSRRRVVSDGRSRRSSVSGALDWLDFTESDDEGDRGLYPHNWSPEMETTAAVLRLSDVHRHVALDLVLTATDTGEAVRLPGPMLWVPERIRHERAPKPKTLGFLAALNPFEQGGIWQTLGRGTKYRACIEERRAAKRRFAAA